MELKIPHEYIIAAKLVDRTTKGQVDFRQVIDWSAVLKVLIKNRVPLNSLKNDPSLDACPLLLSVDFQEAEHAETMIGKSLRDQYIELKQALLQKGIQSILFKSCGLSPSFPYTSDNLDTLVRSDDINLSRHILNALGYVELCNVEEPKKWLFRKFRGGESISAIHLHGVVGWGVPFLDDSALWQRARISEDDPWVMIPSPEDAFLITIAHAFYENKSFKLLDIARIRHCLHQRNFDFSIVEQIARERGWEDGLAFCLLLYNRLEVTLYDETLIPNSVLNWAGSIVSANNWLSWYLKKTLNREELHFPFRVSFLFGKTLYYEKILKDQHRKLATRSYDVISTLAWGIKQKLRIKGQRGMIVSLSGIDGAGKTIHSKSLVKAFETSEVKVHIYWNRFGSSAQSIKHQSSNVASSLARRRRKLHNPLVRSSWLVVNLITFVLRCNLHVRFPRWFGRVVICDRYIYDAIVEIQASLPNNNLWLKSVEWLLTLLCPTPDLAWLLDASAEVSVARQARDDEDLSASEELSKQRSTFQSLASAYVLRVLPTYSRLDETTTQIVRETLLSYYKDYSTWVNALLLSNPSQRNPRHILE